MCSVSTSTSSSLPSKTMLRVKYRTACRSALIRGAASSQILIQIGGPRATREPCTLVAVDRPFEQLPVVHASVPRRIAPSARLQLRAEREQKRESDLLVPEELVLLPNRKLIGRWFGKQRAKNQFRQITDGRRLRASLRRAGPLRWWLGLRLSRPSAVPRLACGLPMFTSWSVDVGGANSVLNTNSASSEVFHTPTPPASTPHIGSAPANRSGWRWTRPAVIMPPNEWPQAMCAPACRTSP